MKQPCYLDLFTSMLFTFFLFVHWPYAPLRKPWDPPVRLSDWRTQEPAGDLMSSHQVEGSVVWVPWISCRIMSPRISKVIVWYVVSTSVRCKSCCKWCKQISCKNFLVPVLIIAASLWCEAQMIKNVLTNKVNKIHRQRRRIYRCILTCVLASGRSAFSRIRNCPTYWRARAETTAVPQAWYGRWMSELGIGK